MNRGELEKQIAKRTDLPIWAVNAVITAFFEVMITSIKKGDQVTVRGFGTFVSRMKSASKKPNPRTGVLMKIPKRRTVVFLPSSQMKERLNGRRRTAR